MGAGGGGGVPRRHWARARPSGLGGPSPAEFRSSVVSAWAGARVPRARRRSGGWRGREAGARPQRGSRRGFPGPGTGGEAKAGKGKRPTPKSEQAAVLSNGRRKQRPTSSTAPFLKPARSQGFTVRFWASEARLRPPLSHNPPSAGARRTPRPPAAVSVRRCAEAAPEPCSARARQASRCGPRPAEIPPQLMRSRRFRPMVSPLINPGNPVRRSDCAHGAPFLCNSVPKSEDILLQGFPVPSLPLEIHMLFWLLQSHSCFGSRISF